ncbi:hypothetical protein RCL_jg26445.t1 [Rhizophagus clarus]|uniref:Uncharacterized protein n=1 Tax=Rhizophagus clarus TaxID=94130 RepID=A0A8H3LLM8_9GLOM|nr:hypothetical protein RCL_jg26445.t1 [Rhizophagus clarus]
MVNVRWKTFSLYITYLAEDFTIEKALYKWSKSVSHHEQSKTVPKGQPLRVPLTAGEGTTSSDKSDKDHKVPNKANTSSSKKRPKKKNKKDNSTITATGKKKSVASKKRKSRPSQGTNDNKQIADLLLGILSLLVPSSKGVVRNVGTSSNR